jgi:YVTN family beta-propeller protein
MNARISSTSGSRNPILAGFPRLFVFSLLMAAFGFHSAQAQVTAYVTDGSNNNVSVIDVASNTVIATIPVGTFSVPSIGNFPVGVVVAPDGELAYVTNFFDGTISIIDTSTNTVKSTINLGAFSGPSLLAITPDGKRLYVPETNNRVAVVSTVTNAVVASITVPEPAAVAITPDGKRAYVQSRLDSPIGPGVHVIDTATNTVVGPAIPVSSINSFGIADAPNGLSIYVTGEGQPNVSAISAVSNAITATISDPGEPLGIAFSPDGGRAYVANFLTNAVNVIDTSTNTVSGSITVGNAPETLAVTPDGAFVYVLNAGDGTVSAVDTSTNSVVATIVVENLPPDSEGIRLIPPEGSVAIANLSTRLAALVIDNFHISPQGFHEQGDFTLGANTGGIDLANQPLTLTVNDFSLTIPAGSFRQGGGNMHFVFNGTVNGLSINFNLKDMNGSTTQFTYVVDVHGVSIGGPNPATIGLKIGHNSGTTTALF